jgi:hypothetical protein
MNRISILSAIVLLVTSCQEWKVLDLGQFSLQVPGDWTYKEENGIDSFVGTIIGSECRLSFDCSEMGYANSLINTPEEYAEEISQSFSYVFMKPGVIYTTGNVEALRKEELKKVSVEDTASVIVEGEIIPDRRIYKPSPKDLQIYRDADFLVELRHRDSVVTMPIVLPDEIRKHNIVVDTVGNYVRKLIWPKQPGHGTTGVYYKKLNGSFNLQISGTDLPPEEQTNAITAFKTIKIKH